MLKKTKGRDGKLTSLWWGGKVEIKRDFEGKAVEKKNCSGSFVNGKKANLRRLSKRMENADKEEVLWHIMDLESIPIWMRRR